MNPPGAPPGGPPAPPAGVPPPMPLAGPVADPVTLADYYESQPDILNGDYGNYMDTYDPTGAANAALNTTVLAAGDAVPRVFLYMPTNDPPIIKVIHTPTVCQPAMGIVSPWDNQNVVFASDIGVGNQIAVARWPANGFDRNITARVPTVATMEAQWTAAAGADCVGPYAAAAPDTEEVTTRRMMAVPPAYVSNVIRHGQYTCRQLWTDLITQLQADNRLVSCQQLVDWARVASTYNQPAAAGGDPGMPSVHGTVLTPIIVDEDLQRIAWRRLTGLMPNLDQRTGTNTARMTQALNQMTNEFTLQRNETATREAARDAARTAPKTMEAKAPLTATRLKTLCEIDEANGETLPEFWNLYANATKQDAITVLQGYLDNRANETTSSRVSPVLTPELYLRIQSAEFAGRDDSDLVGGLSIFLVSPVTSRNAHSKLQRAATYQLITSGGGQPSLEQVQYLISTAPDMPHTGLTYLSQNKAYGTLLDRVMGIDHRTSVHHRTVFLPQLELAVNNLEARGRRGLEFVFPLCMRHTQLAYHEYFQTALTSGAEAPLPEIMELIKIMKTQAFQILPPLPEEYYDVTTDRPIPEMWGLRTLAPSPAPSTDPTNDQTDPNQPLTGNKRLPNNNIVGRHHKRFKKHLDQGKKLADLTRGKENVTPKTSDTKQPLCMLFHLQGYCFASCKRCGSHRQLTPPEITAIDKFLDDSGVPKDE